MGLPAKFDIQSCQHTELLSSLGIADCFDDILDRDKVVTIRSSAPANNAIDPSVLAHHTFLDWTHIGPVSIAIHRCASCQIWVTGRYAPLGSAFFCLKCQDSRHCHHFCKNESRAAAATASLLSDTERAERLRLDLHTIIDDMTGQLKSTSYSQKKCPESDYTQLQQKNMLYRNEWLVQRLGHKPDETQGSCSWCFWFYIYIVIIIYN